jgi:hypothetical protein
MRTQASERLRITEDGFPADIFVRRVDRTESFSDTGVNSDEIGRGTRWHRTDEPGSAAGAPTPALTSEPPVRDGP